MKQSRIICYATQAALIVLGACGSTDPVALPEVSELTVAQIHRAFERGEYNSEQLVRAYLDRIETHDGPLNAISYVNPEAINAARTLDEEYRRTKVLRPLHGIPVIVKDNINTRGLPTTAGSRALLDYVPDDDAFIIARLVDAGAIVLAKSNMAEWAFSPMHTESTTEGITRNPYNPDHVPAGSSGGTAAAVAANLGAVGLGTDTGNSIRGPSSHTALVGFRTTLGLISRSGIVPLYLRNDVVGPMCRTVEDATRVLDALAGYDPADPITEHGRGKNAGPYTRSLVPDGLRGARIGVLREVSDADIDPEINVLFEQAIADLQRLGATITDPVVIPRFAALRQNQWCADFRKDLEAFLAQHVKRDTLTTLEDVIRIGTASSYTEARIRALAEHNGRWNEPQTPCGDAYSDPLRVAFRQAIERVMDSLSLDAIIYPSWNHRPARIDSFQEEYKGDNSQIIAPHTGQPAFTVPMGFTRGNLPAGLQFLGRMYSEATLIRLTYGYEQGTKHRQKPNISSAR